MDLFSLLPDELLVIIIEPLKGDRNALVSLCRTTKQFYRLCNHLLWEAIDIKQDAKSGTIALLVRSLLENQSLSHCIKALSLSSTVWQCRETDGCHQFDGPRVTEDVSTMTTQDKSQLITYCHGFIDEVVHISTSEKREMVCRWKAAIGHHRQTELGGILLLLLPKLENLSITVYEEQTSSCRNVSPLQNLFSAKWIAQQRRSASAHVYAPMKAATRNVTRLSICSGNLSLLNLGFQNVRVLEVDLVPAETSKDQRMWSDEWCGEYWDRSKFKVPKLDEIILHIPCADSPNLINALFVFLKVNKLPIRKAEVIVEHRSELEHTTSSLFGRLVWALLGVEGSLESLKIRICENEPPFGMGCLRDVIPIEDFRLRVFKQLRHLEVPLGALVPKSCITGYRKPDLARFFPKSLEELVIANPDHEILSWLEDFHDANPGGENGGSNLKSISLECWQARGKPASHFRDHNGVLERFRRDGVSTAITDG